MVVRQRKRKNKLRGHRSHGKGNTKRGRGAGSKGGKGRAGSHKHKYSKYYNTFGIKKRLATKSNTRSINLDDLNILIENIQRTENKLEEKEGKLVVDGNRINYNKILSRGNLQHKIIFTNVSFSKKALEKIESFGCLVENSPQIESKEKSVDEINQESSNELNETQKKN